MSRVVKNRSSAVWQRLELIDGLVQRFDVESSPVLAPGSIELRRFTAFAGMHGAGKSYLLAAIGDGLPGWQSTLGLPIENDGSDARLSGSYRLHLEHPAVHEIAYSRPLHWEQRRSEDERHEPLVVTRLTAYVAESERAMAAQETVFLRRFRMIERDELTRSEIDIVGLITGHVYERVVYGVLGEGHDMFPFVEAMRDGRVVNSWSMSASEYWVHFVLQHLRGADANELVLIDEPETSLALPGHRPFIDEIARLTLSTGCQTLIATHSETMLERVPPALIRHVGASEDGSVVTPITNAASLLSSLGRSPRPVACLLFVEDDLAMQILHEILRIFAADELDRFDVVGSAGKDEAIRAAKLVARSRRLSAMAVLDGDQRECGAADDVSFLPGTQEPELMLVNALRSDVDESSNALRVDPVDLRVALDAVRFSTHQRVFVAIAESLNGVSAEELRSHAIRLWLSDSAVLAEARALAEQLLGRISHARSFVSR
ncbi:hypothetical protein DEU35_2621 [Microbacterium sp. AG157]|uniref:ATP-binding protein n=1 Tax=Microbacterium sp. AG157 TaxID=2183993 RepID=UPI000E3933AA|nr:ATP-binding protein [Microbacterium sp. AG157]REC96872.1 hypothetical protein DEU35_2621 [Microbacterium sp. AG157]